jgi:hypothetical protein
MTRSLVATFGGMIDRCPPKDYGGLGIIDQRLQNMALTLKWLSVQ